MYYNAFGAYRNKLHEPLQRVVLQINKDEENSFWDVWQMVVLVYAKTAVVGEKLAIHFVFR